MDQRFKNATLLDRRKKEWNLDSIKNSVDSLFQSLVILSGWEFLSSEWDNNIKINIKEELKRSIVRVLKVSVKNSENETVDYYLQFPELVNDQFFYLGGFLKVPIFQLIDFPIIYRTKSSGEVLKLRTNTISIDVEYTNKGDILLSMFNRRIPIEHIIPAVYSKTEFIEFWEANIGEECDNNILNTIREKCIPIWDTLENNDDRHALVGQYFMNNPQEKYRKGEAIIYSFKAAYDIDIFSKKFMKTNSILFELLYALKEGPRSDTSLEYKRIRLAEYILSPLVKKLYDMAISIYKNPREKFQIPQNIIMDGCTQSDIVHFNFPLNPVGEIASLFQCTLVGPNGFKKSNVPFHLRNLDETHFGRICPADTPDREGCGVILNMVPTVEIDDDGLFLEPDEELLYSHPISLSPFNVNDDPTRLQMASSQAKQAIFIKESEQPWIRTGMESFYLDRTTFMSVAKDDGEVVYKDNKFIIVSYNNGENDVLPIGYRPMYLNTIDYIYTDLNKGDKFVKNDILCSSKFLKNGELSLGRNLLTAIVIEEGFNYEDGIVVSESTTKNMTSLHHVDLTFEIDPGQVLLSLEPDKYKPLPEIGDRLETGQVYARVKILDWEDGFENINEEPSEKTSPCSCVITNIEIFPNNWNKQMSVFNSYILELINKQVSKYNYLIDALEDRIPQDRLKNFITYHGLSYLDCNKKMEKYSWNGDTIKGTLIKISAVYEESIGIGDKLANRHGNKGVISKVLPDDKMPKLPDGRVIDIAINPLGIISRMNVGQIYEMHLGECVNALKKKLVQLDEPNDVKFLSEFLDKMDSTPNKWPMRRILDLYESKKEVEGKEAAVEEIYAVIPAFQATHPSIIKNELMPMVGVSSTYELTIPEIGKLNNKIGCGYMYWLKLVHRANDKVSARSIGPYSQKTSQPLGGKKRHGGHRLGEMEQWALVSHGCKEFLSDLLTVHSDSVGLKNKVLAEILQNPDLMSGEGDNNEVRPQSLLVLDAYMMQLGLQFDFGDTQEVIEVESEVVEETDNESE